MRTANERLQNEVLAELRWDPQVDVSAIGVTVANGVVTLFGDVPSWEMKIGAIDAAGRVAGVRAIADRLTLKVPGCLRRTDTDLASEIADVLRQEACATTVKAHVQDGEVRLEGFVDWPFQRDCAETAIANARVHLHGLKRVANDIIISQPSTLPSLGRSTFGFRPAAAASYLADVSPTAARAEH